MRTKDTIEQTAQTLYSVNTFIRLSLWRPNMLNLSENFNMRLTNEERRMLTTLARYFERTQSDTVRVLIRTAHKNMPGNLPTSDAPGDSLPGQVTATAPIAELSPAEATPA